MNRTSLFLFAAVGLLTLTVVIGQERTEERSPPPPQQVHNHYYPAPGAYGYGYGGGYGYGSGTDVGNYNTGLGNLRLSTSEAAANYANTAHQVQENHNFAVNSYYANKDQHDQWVAAHRQKQLSPEEQARLGKMIEPGRLSTAQFDRSTNVINWPALLRDSDFSTQRQALDHLFHDRTPDNSGVDSDNSVQISAACAAMKDTLGVKLRKENLPSMTFCAAQHFIESIAYEGTFAVK